MGLVSGCCVIVGLARMLGSDPVGACRARAVSSC